MTDDPRVAARHTLIHRVFVALPEPGEDGTSEALHLHTIQECFPELDPKQLHGPLWNLCQEGSFERIAGPEPYYRRLTQVRERRRKAGSVAYKRKADRPTALSEALNAAEARYGKLELVTHLEADPVTSAAQAAMEFNRASAKFEGQFHRVLQELEAVRAERDRLKAILQDLAQRLHVMDASEGDALEPERARHGGQGA